MEYTQMGISCRPKPDRTWPHQIRFGDVIRIAAAMVWILGGTRSAHAFTTECSVGTSPIVSIETSSDEVVEVFDTTEVELRHLASIKGRVIHWPGLGAYISEIAYQADIGEDAKTDEDGGYCAAPTSVRAVISVKRRVIHLARELRAEHCLDEAVRRHLWQHANADEDALKQMPTLAGQLREALANLPPTHSTSAEVAKRLMSDAIRTQFRKLLDSLDKERARLNSAIDAPEAIVQLQARCAARVPS